MIFTFDIAKKLVDYYQFLIGKDFDERPSKTPITHILIAPNDQKQFSVFVSEFNQSGNNQTALYKSGIDKSQVRILLTHHYTWGVNIFTSDLDKYLTRMNIEKVYLNPGFLDNQNQ